MRFTSCVVQLANIGDTEVRFDGGEKEGLSRVMCQQDGILEWKAVALARDDPAECGLALNYAGSVL